MMAGLGSVVIQFLGKDNLSKVANNVGKAISGVDDDTGKAHKSFGKLNAAWAAAVPVAGAVVAAGVSLANSLLEAGKAALEDKQSADKLANTLSKIPGVTQGAIDANESWISGMQLATQVADTDLRTAVGKLTLATGDLKRAQELVTVAVDTAAGSGKNLSTITDALAKAVNGNTGALKRQFPWLDKNKDGAVTLDEAMDGLKGAFKGAAGEAAKNKPWETLKIIFDELKESVGAWLLPVLEDLADWFKNPKNQKKVQDFIDKVGDLARAVGDDAAKELKDWVKWLSKDENQQALKDWARGIGNFADAIGRLTGHIQTLISWINKLPSNWILRKIGLIPDLSTSGAAAASSSSRSRSTPAAAPAQPQPAAVIVTEEQIYRAVERLLMRGQARNGRLARVG